jgi:1-acyl-sn-glycerol-3-phosphate acyltransferase
LLRSYCGIKFLITGDVSNPIDKSKHAIIISNHGSWYDQLYTLGIFLRFGCITQAQFVSSARFNHTFSSLLIVMLCVHYLLTGRFRNATSPFYIYQQEMD